MRITKPKNANEINKLITYLNFCHDASIKRICFLKARDVDKNDGNLIYPFSDVKDRVKCDIKTELILNSYANAKKDQIVLFEFKETTYFDFMQKGDFDYSDIYHLEFKITEDSNLNFNFYATKEKIKILSISCKKIICKEL